MVFLNKLLKINDIKSKTVLKNAFYSFFIKGLNVGVNFLTIPLVLSFLSTTQYGIWLELTAVLGWFALFDLGFGNGLRNHLTISIANKNFKEGKIYVSTTYAALTVIFGSLIVLFIIGQPFINWVVVFNAPPEMAHDINFAVLFSISLLFVQFIVRLINTILLSFQRAAMADFTNTLVQVFILAGLFTLKIEHINTLSAVAVVYASVPILVFVTVSLFLFLKSYRHISPSILFVKTEYVNRLLKLGLSYFIIQISALILYASDNFIIAHLFVPAQVAVYNIAFKYFSITSIFFAIILSPFWSMTTKALTEGDWVWIKASIKKLVLFWTLLLVCGLLQLLISNPLYKIWTNAKVFVPVALSITMFLYFAVFNWCSIYSNFLNGVGKIRIQLYCSVIGMIINIPLAIFLVKVCHLGVLGIPVATIFTMACASIMGFIQYYKVVNKTATGIWNE